MDDISRPSYHKAIQMYKTVCGDAPDYLKHDSILHLRFIQDYSGHIQLYTPRPNTELFRNSFIFSGTSIWNSIHEYTKTEPSVKNFKYLYLRWYKQSSEN